MADIDPKDPELNDQLKLKIRQRFINQVGPFKVVDNLKQFLTDDDIEHIKTCTRNNGNFVGAEELFNRLTQHSGWFPCFVDALNQALPRVASKFDNEYSQLLQELSKARSHEVHLREAKGCTSLLDAASEGHIGCIIDLIFSGDVDLNSKNERGETAVYIAAARGHSDCLEILTQGGCQANLPNKDKESPLYVAAKNGFPRCVEILIETLVKPDVAGNDNHLRSNKLGRGNKHAFTPVWAAAAKGHAECLKLLLDAGASANNSAADRSDGYTPLMAAVIAGEEKCIQILLEAGGETTDRDSFGRTPLFIAAMEGKTKCLQILIEAGADINAPIYDGETPLCLAAKYLQLDSVNALLSAGADVHRISKRYGHTALMMAAFSGDEESLKAIVEAGPNLNSQDHKGQTALMWAAKFNYDICGQILVENGADIHLRDKLGKTALHYAACFYTLLLTILVDLGADVNAVDNNGETPLMEAAREFPVDPAGLYLLEKGADPDKVSCNGLTALMFAEKADPRGKLSKLLREKKNAELPPTKVTKPVPASDHKKGDAATSSGVQMMDVLNRLVEVEYCTEFEDSLQQSHSNCQKNPGHVGFIPITEFGLSHLPDKYRDQRIIDVIKAQAELTVRLLVKYTSPDRPDGYNASNMRGKKGGRVGSGWIEIAWAKFTAEDKEKCPCSVCEASGNPKMEWGKLEVKTAMHVVYDSSEAKQTLVHIFADVDKPKDMHRLYGYDVNFCNQDEDICSMLVATHDLQLWNYIKSMRDHKNRTWEHCKGLANELVAIVSHPHGCSKQVTIGKWTERHSLSSKSSKCRYTYNVPTCKGSSGAPVIVFGDRYRATDHPHSGSTKQQGFNLSGSGSDVPADLKFYKELQINRNLRMEERGKNRPSDRFRPVGWNTLIEPKQERPESPVQPLYDYQQRPPKQAST